MNLELKITNKEGFERVYNIRPSSFSEEKSLNDFILEALMISEDKRELPFLMVCPSGEEFYPSIKMKFENYGSPLLGDQLEAMVITHSDF